MLLLNLALETLMILTLSLHDALPIWSLRVHRCALQVGGSPARRAGGPARGTLYRDEARHRRAVGDDRLQRDRVRSEEHTSELQSHSDLVCRLRLDKKSR